MANNDLPSYGALLSEEDAEERVDGDHNLSLHPNDENKDNTRSSSFLVRKFPSLTSLQDVEGTVVSSLQIIRNSSFVLTGEDCSHHHHRFAGTATIPSEVANMTKNMIGGGVLSLSAGIAIYSSSPKGVVSAIYLTVILGAVFAYFCLLIGKSCQMSHSATYRECWERTVGHRGGVTVAVVNTLDPLLGILANASILSQSLQLLLQGLLNIYWNQVQCLLVITVVGLLPLCLLKNLNALAPFSAMGMLAVLIALAAMMVRWLDGSYRPGGIFYEDLSADLQPSFGTRHSPWSVSVLPFVCMVFTSYDMHYNSPRFYAELKDASIPRFGQVVSYSFGLTAVVYFSIAVVGFLTFGEHCDSYILNNYSPKDGLATLSRLTIGLCSLVSYPLNFIGVRDNCLDILGITAQVDTAAKLNVFTIMLLSLLTLVSCFVTDLGLINSVGGGTTVTLVCFIFPAVMFREGIRKFGGSSREAGFVLCLTVVGVLLGIVGVWASILYA